MIIDLLRHAIAVLQGREEYPGDDRPLTPEGVAKIEKNAAGMPGPGRLIWIPTPRQLRMIGGAR